MSLKKLFFSLLLLSSSQVFAKTLTFITIVPSVKVSANLNFGNLDPFLKDDCLIRLEIESLSMRNVFGEPMTSVSPAYPAFTPYKESTNNVLHGADSKGRQVWFWVGLSNLAQFESGNTLRLNAACWR